MKHILFSNYTWENDEFGMSAYDYAREELFENDEEHRFSDDDYTTDQIQIDGLETYVCPICGEKFDNLQEAKECCRDEKWETPDDIPDEMVSDFVEDNARYDFEDFKVEFDHFIRNSNNAFLLCGDVGRWTGSCAGGCYVSSFDDLYAFFDDCVYIKVYDENGHLYLEGSHHDGSNFAELKELTNKGCQYRDEHKWDSDQEVHSLLFNSNFYTRLPHYARSVWGARN